VHNNKYATGECKIYKRFKLLLRGEAGRGRGGHTRRTERGRRDLRAREGEGIAPYHKFLSLPVVFSSE